MGDLSDMNDLDRFMRSPQGQAQLDEMRRTLVGQRIVGVEFSNETCRIGITILVGYGGTFKCTKPDLEIDILREDFAGAIDSEYIADYPSWKYSATCNI